MTTATTFEILNGKQTVDNYPYGRLQCTITFDIEYKKGKGYRAVTQTINPKTGRLNAPKYSTYCDFMFMVLDEKGHVKFEHKHFYGFDDIASFIELIQNHEFTLSDEETQALFANILASIRANANYTRRKETTTKDQFIDAIKFKEILHLFSTHANIKELANVGYDIDLIQSLKL
jgi:hypothetical protein